MPGSIRSSTTRSGRALSTAAKRAGPVGGERHLEVGALQIPAHHVAHRRVVIDDQYALPHQPRLDRTATAVGQVITPSGDRKAHSPPMSVAYAS